MVSVICYSYVVKVTIENNGSFIIHPNNLDKLVTWLRKHEESIVQETKKKRLTKAQYSGYISSSPIWKKKRKGALERANGKCQICNDPAEEVHHNNYDNLGNESPSDLLAVCVECHGVLTNDSRERRYKKTKQNKPLVLTPTVENTHKPISADEQIRKSCKL